MTTSPTVLKLGGELLERQDSLDVMASNIAALARKGPLVVIHGGGREIDTELSRRGVPKQAVDGLRITDEPTLAVVVAVLAGTVNTRLVAALGRHGVSAVGLTGADDMLVTTERRPAYRTTDGRHVNLGLVGEPTGQDRPSLLFALLDGGYVPVVASLGVTPAGELLNVNADTLAAHLAVRLDARRLLLAGSTPGVLDGNGQALSSIDLDDLTNRLDEGSVHSGMVAKLLACREALRGGVPSVSVIDGRVPIQEHSAEGTTVRAGQRKVIGVS